MLPWGLITCWLGPFGISIKPTTIINTPFLELSNDPACPAGLVAMGRGSVCAWKWQGELRGISWRFRGAGAEVQLTSRWAPAWDFWLAGGTSAVIAQGARRTLHSPPQGLERWSWVVFPQDLRKFLENDLVTVSCIFLQIFSYVHIKVNKLLSECVCVCVQFQCSYYKNTIIPNIFFLIKKKSKLLFFVNSSYNSITIAKNPQLN